MLPRDSPEIQDTFLKDAIIQNGRKIVIDVDKAMRLFAQREEP